MTNGERLFLTCNYGFKYDKGHATNFRCIDFVTQFFEHRNNLEGYISDEEGERIEENSELSVIIDRLYRGIDDRNIPQVVETMLHEFEMYETLSEYHAPLSEEGQEHKEILENCD